MHRIIQREIRNGIESKKYNNLKEEDILCKVLIDNFKKAFELLNESTNAASIQMKMLEKHLRVLQIPQTLQGIIPVVNLLMKGARINIDTVFNYTQAMKYLNDAKDQYDRGSIAFIKRLNQSISDYRMIILREMKGFETDYIILEENKIFDIVQPAYLEFYSVLITLASLYTKLEEYNKAIECYSQIIESLKPLHPKTDKLTANAHDLLASALMITGEYNKAIVSLEEAFEIYETKLKGTKDRITCEDMKQNELSPNIMKTLHELETAYERIGNYNKSKIYASKSREICHPFVQRKRSNKDRSSISLGDDYSNDGQPREGKNKCVQFIEEMGRAHSHSDNANERAFILNKIGQECMDLGEFNNATNLFHEAIDIFRSHSAAHPEVTAKTLENLADSYNRMKEFKKAIIYYNESFLLKKTFLPEFHISIIQTMIHMGLNSVQTGDSIEAIRYYTQALDSLTRIFSEKHPYFSTLLSALGKRYLHQGEFHRALEYFQAKAQVIKLNSPDNFVEIGRISKNIALVYMNLGEYKKAVDFLRESIEITKRSMAANKSEIAETLAYLGKANGLLGDWGKSRFFYMESLQVYKAILPDHHATLRSIEWSFRSASAWVMIQKISYYSYFFLMWWLLILMLLIENCPLERSEVPSFYRFIIIHEYQE